MSLKADTANFLFEENKYEPSRERKIDEINFVCKYLRKENNKKKEEKKNIYRKLIQGKMGLIQKEKRFYLKVDLVDIRIVLIKGRKKKKWVVTCVAWLLTFVFYLHINSMESQ